MARVTFPGIGVDFDEDNFRALIKATMLMGTPEDVQERLAWCWNVVDDFAVADPANRPYDWTETPTTSVPGNADVPSGSLVVDCAIELQFQRGNITETPLGEIDTSHLIVTLLDVDYEQIKTADYAQVADTIYDINFSSSDGLFGVTVWTVYLRARDEA